MVERCLRALAQRYDNEQVQIDRKVFNSARITKLYGTMARKGDSTDERPHRLSAVIDAPPVCEPVPAELLNQLAGRPDPNTNKTNESTNGHTYGTDLLRRAWNYIDKMPRSISGQGGHTAAFNVARKLIKKFELSDHDALSLMRRWNEGCQGPWDDKDLVHKITSARKTARAESGLRSDCGQHDNDEPSEEWPTSDVLANYGSQEVDHDGKPAVIKVGLPITTITDVMYKSTHQWPKRVGSLLFAEDDDHHPLWLESADALFAWIGRVLSGGVRWVGGEDKVTKGEFYHGVMQTAEPYDAVEPFPHYPPMPRTWYMHQDLQGGDGQALGELLARFKPATLVDGDLLRAFFLSLLWGGAPGQRPAWLFTSEDNDPETGRGVGKSTAVKMGALLVGGHVDGSANEPMEKLITRLLSVEGIDKRVVLVDNVKTLRFSWGELEGLITNDTVSGHRMYAGEGRRPNTLTYCLTLNGASLSKDMAQRCVIVKVARPPRDAGWEEGTRALIQEKRWAILGDLLEALRAPAEPLKRYSRWASWEAAVLARVGDPSECQKVIAERQGEVDEDAAAADVVREAFLARLKQHGLAADTAVIWFVSKDVADIVNEATDEKRARNKATAYLRTLGIPELRESRRGTGRGWTWHGSRAPADAPATLYSDFVPV